MLLTIETTHVPATDLGYLLHKNPSKVQSFSASFGQVHVFYPVAREDLCRVAMLLDIDPVGLVRNRKGPSGNNHSLDQYVNDRPYVASSFMSVAMSRLFSTAMNGRSKERADLVDKAIPLKVKIAVLPCRGGEEILRRLFEPLGYLVDAVRHPLDEMFPAWGDGAYHTVTLSQTITVQQLLQHLYVLIPVLDNDKHYWVGDEEVEKLLTRGKGWLADHPEKELIAKRYLKYQYGLARDAIARLVDADNLDPDVVDNENDAEEEAIEKPLSLNMQRIGSVVSALKACGAIRILDLGCGEGQLLRELLKEKQFTQIVGIDVSMRALQRANDRLKLERLPLRQRDRIKLQHGSLIYRDDRLAGFDAAAVVEVIEHLDPPRLHAFERTIFQYARPDTVIVTTPNSEYNIRWETLPAGKFRHKDHRFEWTREEFHQWADNIGKTHGYSVRYLPVGPDDPEVGPPTQMAVFEK